MSTVFSLSQGAFQEIEESEAYDGGIFLGEVGDTGERVVKYLAEVLFENKVILLGYGSTTRVREVKGRVEEEVEKDLDRMHLVYDNRSIFGPNWMPSELIIWRSRLFSSATSAGS